MITSIYRGGLGNQLFQVAAGYALAKENNDQYKMNLDLHYERGQGRHVSHYANSIFSNIEKTNHKSTNLYKEPEFPYNKIPYREDLLLDGYFQSEKYFQNYRKEINELFKFDVNESKSNICTIQVRMGDYLRLPDFNVVTKKYFTSAVEYVNSKSQGMTYYVITDDIDQARNYIPEINYKHLPKNSEVEDFDLLSNSDYCIISNSSYGWWGSYFGKNKTVIVPNKWFNNSQDPKDIYRDDMTKFSII